MFERKFKIHIDGEEKRIIIESLIELKNELIRHADIPMRLMSC